MTNYEKIKQLIGDKSSLVGLIKKLASNGVEIDKLYCRSTCEGCKAIDDGDCGCAPDEETKCIERWLDEEVPEQE